MPKRVLFILRVHEVTNRVTYYTFSVFTESFFNRLIVVFAFSRRDEYAWQVIPH